MKGQMFIIAAIIIAVSLILLKEYFVVFDIIEEARFQQSSSLAEKARNIKDEYKNIVNIALQQESVNESAKIFLKNFTEQIRDEVDALYIFAYVNATRHEIYLLVANYLGDRIDMVVNATNTVFPEKFFDDIQEKESRETVFYFYPGFEGVVNIRIEYEIQDEIVKEEIPINVSQENQALFFDVKIRSSTSMLRVKDVYAPTLSQMIEYPSPQQDAGVFCGNAVCEESESCGTCYQDCCPGYCGNAVCEGPYGESCSSCSADCGTCLPQQGGEDEPCGKFGCAEQGSGDCCTFCNENDSECLNNCDPSC